MRKKRKSQLPRLALMASLVAFEAQAGVVSKDQLDWQWRETPVKEQLQNEGNQGQATTNDGNSNALMWYMLGNMMGSSNSGSSGSNFSNQKSAPAKPNPDTSHWNNSSSGSSKEPNKPSSSNSSNNSGSSNSNKGYSTGGMGSGKSNGFGGGGFSSSGG